jgi:4-amino-4-deoxy-L-arabinose transferase-like glycosyltransferase
LRPFSLSSNVPLSTFSLEQRRRWAYHAALLAIVFSLLAGLGLRQPNPPDEPRFVLAARTMVESGHWLLPHRGSELYAEKPPVFMWLQASAYELVHDWRIAFLLPSLLAALATLWLTWDLTRRLWNRRVARYAVLALFATLQFGVLAKRAQIDMVLVAMTTLSLWGLLRHLLRGPDWPAWMLGAFAAGVGTVTKGVGFLPLLALLSWAAWRHRHRAQAVSGPWPHWLSVIPAFLAGTAVWLLPLGIALWRDPDPTVEAYARELLFKQTGTRYASAWHHVQPAWYYLKVIATLWLPSCLLLPALLPAWWRRLRRGDPRYAVLLGWSVLVLVFFSASPGKREVYIFPMLPALCVAAAPLLAGLLRRRAIRLVLAGYVWLLALITLMIGIGLQMHAGWAMQGALKRAIDPAAMQVFGTWLLVFAIPTVLLAAWLRLRHTGALVVAASALLWTVHGLGLMPALDPYSSAAGLMQRVGQRIGPDAELGMVAWREQNLLQADRPAVDFGFKQPWEVQWARASEWVAQAPQRRWLFVLREAMSPCVDPARVIDIGESNRNAWQLVPGDAVRPGCVTHEATQEEAPGDGD